MPFKTSVKLSAIDSTSKSPTVIHNYIAQLMHVRYKRIYANVYMIVAGYNKDTFVVNQEQLEDKLITDQTY